MEVSHSEGIGIEALDIDIGRVGDRTIIGDREGDGGITIGIGHDGWVLDLVFPIENG